MRKFLTSILENLTEKIREKEPHKSVEVVDLIEHKRSPKIRKTLKERKQKEKNSSIKEEIKEAFPEVSPQKMKLICAAGDIRLDPDKTESAFMARQLVQATLPHKNPGNVPAWSRTNGGLTVSIQPGIDSKQKVTGYPYGTIPRLLLFWLTTEAVRTNSPRIELGNNLAQFMTTLGLNPRMCGKRGDVKRLQDQMQRLFYSRISFTQKSRGGESWLNMQVTSKGMLWWDANHPSQPTLWQNWVQIGEEFFKAITSSPVPVDMRILKALKKSPLALDLYSWATYIAYQTQKTGQSRSVSWGLLHQQFGTEYGDVKDFSKKAWKALLKVQSVYSELCIERVRGGILILPSQPSITIKPKKLR